MKKIELKNIYKDYHSDHVITHALNDIDLSIEAGEFVAVMGTSGSGKTTLLNLMGCMDKPTKGSYFLDGIELGSAKEKERALIRSRKIAFVFQHFALMEGYTVMENVELPLLKQKLSKKERKDRILLALRNTGMAELAKKRVSCLSGGQKQRTAIARAVACGADVILADEPTGALDCKTGQEIMELLKKLNENGQTVVVITHDRQVASYAERVVMLEDGRIVQDEKM